MQAEVIKAQAEIAIECENKIRQAKLEAQQACQTKIAEAIMKTKQEMQERLRRAQVNCNSKSDTPIENICNTIAQTIDLALNCKNPWFNCQLPKVILMGILIAMCLRVSIGQQTTQQSNLIGSRDFFTQANSSTHDNIYAMENMQNSEGMSNKFVRTTHGNRPRKDVKVALTSLFSSRLLGLFLCVRIWQVGS